MMMIALGRLPLLLMMMVRGSVLSISIDNGMIHANIGVGWLKQYALGLAFSHGIEWRNQDDGTRLPSKHKT